MNLENSLQKAAACVGVCCLSFSMVVIAQSTPSGGTISPGAASGAAAALSAGDRAFVMEAAVAGMSEAALGQLAGQKASNAQVRQYGERMVQDHGRAHGELQALAAARGVRLPARLSGPHQAEVDRMGELSGTEFDRAYVSHMVADHQAAVARFAKQSQAGADPELKDWATRTLPTLREHLQQAQDLQSSVHPGR